MQSITKPSSNSKFYIVSFAATAIIFYFLLFTRIGVFFVFDLLGDYRGTDNFTTTMNDAPVEVTRVLDAPQEIKLPDRIEQVSGIIMHNNEIVLSTDQTEFFRLSSNGSEIIKESNIFPWTPTLLKQGSLETISIFDGHFWLAGEYSSFVRTNYDGEVIDTPRIPGGLKSDDITGFATAGANGFLTINGQINITQLDFVSDEANELVLDFSEVSRQVIQDDDLLWSGIAYHNGQLYLVAENFPLIVVADVNSGLVTEVLGISGQHEFSDIAVANEKIYLPSDHNYFDPRPPLRVFDLPVAQ